MNSLMIMGRETFPKIVPTEGKSKKPQRILRLKSLWIYGDTPERLGKPKPFGYGTTAEGPSMVNL